MPLTEPTMVINALQLSMMDWRSNIEQAQERAIVRAREYHDGEQAVFLTARLKEFLGLNADGNENATFRLNVCRVVVEALSERMLIDGFDASDDTVKAWAEEAWQGARMDAFSNNVHIEALRDGESFVIVDWDAEAGRVRFFSNPRYTSIQASGDGFGVVIFYPNNDISQRPLFAVKRWSEFVDPNSRTVIRQRATFYFDNRIEKYWFSGAGWVPTTDADTEPWPIPWVGHDGKPLGMPVIHFHNKGLRSEAWDAIPIQDAINKTFVDLLAQADLTAFRIFVALGFIPTSDGKTFDGSNGMDIAPGQVIGTTAPVGQADFKAIDGAPLSGTLDMLQHLLLFLAMVTGTPLARFQITGNRPSSDTLKQQEEPLLAKVRNREVLFGDNWEDALNIARRVYNTFSKQAKLDETIEFGTIWADASARTDTEKFAEWTTMKAMGIPRRYIWKEMGYDQDTIDTMMADPEVVFGPGFGGYPGGPAAGTKKPVAKPKGAPGEVPAVDPSGGETSGGSASGIAASGGTFSSGSVGP
jgi:Phage portal protein, SPP1 Gp6-like